MRIRTALSVIPRMAHLLLQLSAIWMTLDWRVRKARKAFERELIRQGVSRDDARRLSRQIKIAKDELMSSIWHLTSK